MKRLLHTAFCRAMGRGLCASLGLLLAAGASRALAQELNFRAVVPRHDATQAGPPSAITQTSYNVPVRTTGDIPISLNTPRAVDVNFVARGKFDGEGGLLAPGDIAPPMPQVGPRPLPTGSPTDFIPPPPTMVTPAPGGTMIKPGPNGGPINSPGGAIIHGSPTIVGSPGAPMPSGVTSGPIMNGQIMNGQIVNSPAMSGSVPGSVVVNSGPVVGTMNGGTVFGGFFDGLLAEDPINAGDCGSCGGCGVGGCGFNGCGFDGCDWRPLQRVKDWLHCGCRGCCDPRPGLWVRGEFLLWSTTGQNIPPLFIGAPTNDQLQLSNPDAHVLFDDSNMSDRIQNGGRFTLGFWFPRCNDWGMDASYFFLGSQTTNYSNFSTGENGATGRPFVDSNPNTFTQAFGTQNRLEANTVTERAEIVAANGANGLVPGGININASSNLWGGDINLRRKLCCGQGWWFDGLIGYRQMQLEDQIRITENIGPRTLANSPGASAQNTIVSDYFSSRNTFHGAQVGLEAEWRFWRRLTLGGSVKVAVGNINQQLLIDGYTTISGGNFNGVNKFARQTQSGGLLAQGTNMGRYSTDRFGILPEGSVKLGWDITPHLRFFAAYNVLYMSNVMRAGEQIDLNVNSSQLAFNGYTPKNAKQGDLVTRDGSHGILAGPAQPAVQFRTAEFWAQGVSFGLEYRY